MEQPTIENLELTTQQDGSTDTRRSAARIAVVQFNPQVGVENLECNMRAVTERLEQAAAQRADVIVLPELATTGYTFNSRAEAYAHAEKVPTGHTIQAWEGFSKKHQVYIVGCLPELDGSQLFDTAVLIGPDGYIGKYRKTHLWNEEKLFFTPGNLATETIEELARALRSQVKTSRDLVENALSSIKRLNPQLNGFSSIDETGALASADRVDQELCSGRDRGLLHGIPIAIKDIIDVAGQKTTSGSALYVDRYAEKDAEVVRLLREAGAIIIGKTVLHEFAYGATCDRSVHGASRNPYDPTRMSGGSSGGSAVAVASGMVPLALGTDTAGSVRVPAAFCGIVGYKPAFDAIPTRGVYPLAASLDHVGVFARTVKDARLAYEVLAKTKLPPGDPDGSALRIGWVTPGALGPIDKEIEKQSLEILLSLEIHPEPVTLPGAEKLFEIFSTIQASEAYSEHVDDLDRGAAIIDQEVAARLQMGAEILAWTYVRANNWRNQFRAYVCSLFETYDLLALPTVPITAPKINQRRLFIAGASTEVRSALLSLTSPWNSSGTPALSVPCGLLNGLPIGLQLVSPAGREALLFSVASRIERRNVIAVALTGRDQ